MHSHAATSNREGLDHERIKLVQGDIINLDSLVAGMKGCTHVFHLAAYAKNWAPDPKIFYNHNVIGMRNVFEAAKRAQYTTCCLDIDHCDIWTNRTWYYRR